MELAKLFSGEIEPNVYLIPYSENLINLSLLAKEHEFAFFVFDGNIIHNKYEFLDQFEQIMKPPKCGRNWDAFEEFFRAADWIQAQGIVVVYKDFQYFMTSPQHDYGKEDFNTLIDIFVQMPKFRKSRSEKFHMVPFYVLLQGNDTNNLPINQL